MLLALLFTLASHTAHASELLPSFEARVFKSFGETVAMGELKARNEVFGLRYRAVTVGAYHFLHSNLRVGVFYGALSGWRYTEDWINGAWKDSNSRIEHSVQADASPRAILRFLSSEDRWVGELKARYHVNFGHPDYLTLRPGISLHLGEVSRFRTTLQYERYFGVDEEWVYGSFLMRISSLNLGPHFSHRWVRWNGKSNSANSIGLSVILDL